MIRPLEPELMDSPEVSGPVLGKFHRDLERVHKLLGSFPTLVPIFQQVTPGLAHYKPLIDTMQANVNNYAQVDSLPNFNLFTWFFEIPGVLITIMAVLGLGLFTRRSTPRVPASSSTHTTD